MLLRTFTCFAVAAAMLLAVPTTEAAPLLFSATGPGGAIGDGTGSATPGATFTSVISVPGGFGGSTQHVSVEFGGLAHPWVGDLWVRLIHPDGLTSIDLLSRPGRGAGATFGFAQNFSDANSYSFSDAGATLFDVAPSDPIPSGDYLPSSNPNHPSANALAYAYTPQSFAAIFGGMNPVGDWTLEITDWADSDTGSFRNWTLNVEVDQVPEPATLALFGLGGFALARRARARARRP